MALRMLSRSLTVFRPLSSVDTFLSDRRQRVRLEGKISTSLDVVLGVPQGRVLGPFFILYTSKLFHIVGSHIVDYADNTSTTLGEMALVIPRCRADQFSLPFLPVALRLWNVLPSCVFCGGTLSSLKRAMKLCLLRACLDFFKSSMVVSRYRTIAPGYGDLTLGGAELEELESAYFWGSLRI